MEILKVCNVSYTYESKFQKVEAVKNVSCVFESGKMYAITGESGSGKSSLLSLLAGLDVPTSGEILYKGKSLQEMDRTKYRKDEISIIYQAFNLFPLLTAVQNVQYPLELNGMSAKEAEKKAKECLEMVDLTEEKHMRRPSRMSGGEQQRVAVARALAKGAFAVLADEPTGNLDSKNTDNVTALLKKIAQETETAVIIVTHDRELAEQADTIFSMKDGELTVQSGGEQSVKNVEYDGENSSWSR
jgi:ABC-type antimicrobial peptide transport system, ATPase component